MLRVDTVAEKQLLFGGMYSQTGYGLLLHVLGYPPYLFSVVLLFLNTWQLLQRKDYCLVECTAKKDMDKSNKYQWHVVCTRTEESLHGEIKGHGRSQHICLKHTCKCACTLQIAAE